MRILYIHQYFRTPEEGGCVRSYHLARGLVAQGHEVTMITAHNRLNENLNIDGINVEYLKIPYKNQYGFIRRIWAFISFVRKSKRKVSQLNKRFDLAYVMTTPLTTGFIALHLKSKYDIPYYFEVGDLWPEVPIKIGAIRSSIFKHLLYRFEKKCYFEAQKVIALSPSIRNYIEATCRETRVHVVTNFADTEFFSSQIKLQTFNRNNPLKVGYFGTFGAANQLNYLVKVAQLCEDKHIPVQFTLMGEGAQFEMIRRQTKKLKNTRVLPFGNSYDVKPILEAQDAVYVSFKNLEILNTGSPNKFFDGLAAGKLIILNFGGWIRSVVDKHKAGFYHDPNNPMEFVRKIEVFLRDPILLLQYQQNARSLAEKYYSKNLQSIKLNKIIQNEKHISISDSEVYILTA